MAQDTAHATQPRDTTHRAGTQVNTSQVAQDTAETTCVVCAVPRAAWLLFTGVPFRWVVLLARCPGLLRSCSPAPPLGVLCCARR